MGLTIFSGVDRGDILNYRLDFGGKQDGWDRYRLRVPGKKLDQGAAKFFISYPEYFDGKFDINKEQGKNKNLVRFENRDPAPRWHPKDKWVSFAKGWFDKAATERARKTGKGETGLEQ